MRVLLVTSGDGFADILATELTASTNNFSVVGVIFTQLSLSQKIRLMVKAIRKQSFYFACYLYFESIASKWISLRSKSKTIAQFCKKERVPSLNVTNLNNNKSIQFIENIDHDIVLSLRPGQIFHSKFISATQKILNIHCSRLPNYRGMGSVLQTLAAGEAKTSISFHLIENEEVDNGPIVLQKKVNINPKQSVFGVTATLYRLASSQMVKALCNLNNGSEIRAGTGGNSYSWPGKEPLVAIKKQGRSLVSLNDFFS